MSDILAMLAGGAGVAVVGGTVVGVRHYINRYNLKQVLGTKAEKRARRRAAEAEVHDEGRGCR